MSDTLWKIGLGLAVLVAVFFLGRQSKTVQILSTPTKTDTVWLKQDTIRLDLPAKTVYKVPDSTVFKIKQLGNNLDSLKNKIVELSQPYSTEHDSANYYLYILSHPFEKTNKVVLNLKQLQLTKTIYVSVPETAWWVYPSIAVAGIIGYSIHKQ